MRVNYVACAHPRKAARLAGRKEKAIADKQERAGDQEGASFTTTEIVDLAKGRGRLRAKQD